jgi:hypothetical protein
VFTIPRELAELPTPAPVDKLLEQVAAQRKANGYNAVLFLGAFGALAGGSLALGEAVFRRNIRAALVTVPACALVAGLFGGLAGYLGHAIHAALRDFGDWTELTKTMAMQGAMLATLLGGVGLVCGSILQRRMRTAVACLAVGLLAGVLAGMLYPMLAAVLLPTASTKPVVPDGPIIRLMWVGLAAVLLGLTVPRAARSRVPRPARAPTDEEQANPSGDDKERGRAC